MALLFANHTVQVFPRTETADALTKVVGLPAEGLGVHRSCQIKPLRAQVVLDSRTGAELLNPHSMKCEPEDIDSIPYAARVYWEQTGQQFRITRKPMLHRGDGDLAELNYGEAEMELLEMLPGPGKGFVGD